MTLQEVSMVMTTPITWLMLTDVKSVLHVPKIGQGASRKRFMRSSVPNLTGARLPKAGWSIRLLARSYFAPLALHGLGACPPLHAFVVYLCAANRLFL